MLYHVVVGPSTRWENLRVLRNNASAVSCGTPPSTVISKAVVAHHINLVECWCSVQASIGGQLAVECDEEPYLDPVWYFVGDLCVWAKLDFCVGRRNWLV